MAPPSIRCTVIRPVERDYLSSWPCTTGPMTSSQVSCRCHEGYHLSHRHWGRNARKKVVICIVTNDRQKINLQTLSVVIDISAYQQGIATEACGGKYIWVYYSSTSHNAWLPSCLRSSAVSITTSNNSHHWSFKPFGTILQSNICVFFRVPCPDQFNLSLWKVLDINLSVGRACGESVPLKAKYGQKLLNTLGPSPIQL